MHSTNTNNCHLEAILVPEPFPHLKLIVVASTPILPCTHPYASAPTRTSPSTTARIYHSSYALINEQASPDKTSYFTRSSTYHTKPHFAL